MTVEFLTMIAGSILSLIFSYVGPVARWYEGLQPNGKRLVMLGSLAVAAAGIYGVSCAGWYPLVTCDLSGVQKVIEIFFLAAFANQGTYLLSPKPDKPEPEPIA